MTSRVRVRRSVDDGELGEIGAGFVRDAKDDERAVVVGSGTWAAVIIGLGEDSLGDGASGIPRRNGAQDSGQALEPELLVGSIGRFQNPIGSENHHVAGLEVDAGLVVLRARKQAQRDTFQTNGYYVSIAKKKRIGRPGIRKR